MKAVHLLAGAALALTSAWVAAQDSPESLLPKMFDEPAPAPSRSAPPRPQPSRPAASQAPRPAASAAATTAPRPAATSTPVVQALPTGTPSATPTTLAQDDGTLRRIPSLEELERMSPEDFESLLGSKVLIDMPPASRRSAEEAGLLDAEEGGLPMDSLRPQNGALIRTVLNGNRGQLVSRWGHILLRRALASRLNPPQGMNAADFLAMRVGLLLRMGETDAARAVLHPPGAAALSGRTALAVHGLRGWEGDEVTAIVRAGLHLEPLTHPGVRLHRTRRPFEHWCTEVDGLPVLGLAPAALLLAARLPSERAAGGVLAAVVQQRLADGDELLDWLERLRPLARSAHLRRTLGDIAGGAQSMAEIDIGHLCREHDLADPGRQEQRRDREGRLRWIDATWVTASGITVALEVDGAFHRDAEQWADDIARQRALTSPTYLVVRCTAQELRDHPERIAADLRALGVPRRTAAAAAAAA